LIRNRTRLLLAGILTLLVGLLILFPARVAYNWVAPAGIKLSGLSGTVWSGSAAEISAAGVYARDLQWRMKPLALFTGRVAYAFKASPTSGFVDGNVAVGLGGAIILTDLNGALSLQSIEQVLGIPGIRGDVSIRIESLHLIDGFPVSASGVLEVANLRAPRIDRSSIGGYRAELFTQESGVGASIEDTDGVIDVAGSLQLSADRSYQFVAQLAAKEGTSAGIRQQLQFLGSANDRGQHELRLEGRL
jgi:general secretion pathway protein N